MRKTFKMVKIGRLPHEHSKNYEVWGLPEGADFRDKNEYEYFEAPWLKLNGVGFSGSGVELSEKDEMIGVEQAFEGGKINLEVPASKNGEPV